MIMTNSSSRQKNFKYKTMLRLFGVIFLLLAFAICGVFFNRFYVSETNSDFSLLVDIDNTNSYGKSVGNNGGGKNFAGISDAANATENRAGFKDVYEENAIRTSEVVSSDENFHQTADENKVVSHAIRGVGDIEILSWPTASSIVYGDNLGKSVLTGGEATVGGEEDAGGRFVWIEEAELMAAGSHSREVRFVTSSGELSAQYETLLVEVAKKTVNVSVSEQQFVYNGLQQFPTLSITNLVGSDECEFVLDIPFVKDAGKYSISILSLSNANYTLPIANQFDYEISPKQLFVEWVGPLFFTFDGLMHAPTVRVTGGLIGSDKCDIGVSGAKANVGAHSASMETVSNPNYSVPKGGAASISFSITPKNVWVDWGSITLPYNGVLQAPYAKIRDADLIGEDKSVIAITGKSKDVGVGYLATASSINGNYNIVNNSIEYSIIKAKIKVKANNIDSYYLTRVKTLTYSVIGRVYSNDNLNVVLSTDVVRDSEIGAYKINIYAENDNYDIEFLQGTYSVEEYNMRRAILITVLIMVTLFMGEVSYMIVRFVQERNKYKRTRKLMKKLPKEFTNKKNKK